MKKAHVARLRGAGELLGMAIASILICTLFCFLVAFFQFSGAINAMTNAATTASRATALCDDEKTAKTASLEVAKAVLSRNRSISNVSVDVKPVSSAHASGKFEPGQLVKVTVYSKIKTIEPYIVSKDKMSRSYVVMIEGSGGGTFNGTAKQVEKMFWNYLSNYVGKDGKKLNKAGILGIMANINRESGFDPTANSTKSGTDSNQSVGIAQWTFTRKKNNKDGLLDKYPTNWQTPQAQFAYLTWELEAKYPSLWKELVQVPNTKAGAYDAAKYFVKEYERPSDIPKRQQQNIQYIDKHW